MKTYQLQLLNCNNHNIEISRYLQILTRIEKEDADRIVSNVPVVLYDNLDEECAGYFEEALDYYQAEYEIQPMPEECDIQKFPSRQVIVLGRVMEELVNILLNPIDVSVTISGAIYISIMVTTEIA